MACRPAQSFVKGSGPITASSHYTTTANSIRVIKNNGAGLRGETASTSSQIQLYKQAEALNGSNCRNERVILNVLLVNKYSSTCYVTLICLYGLSKSICMCSEQV